MNNQLARQARVLIIDDQILAKGYLKYTLEELGFQHIIYTDDAETAVEHIKTSHFELVICAYDLKHEKEGYFLYQQLQDHRQLPLTTGFVFISADTSAEIVHSIVELQPDEFLAKPFSNQELDKRLERVLERKHALHGVYVLMEKQAFPDALIAVEQILANTENAEFIPLALRTKGELLLLCEHFTDALSFYENIKNVQNFTWAQLGLVRSLLHLDRDEEAEKHILRLAFHPDTMLSAYDLLAALQIKQNEFDDALEAMMIAGEISPNNIKRHQQAWDLARITHDYEAQFLAAKRIVKYAHNSIHDKPENYLNVARAGIDFAMTTDSRQAKQLIEQTTSFLEQMKTAFPKSKDSAELKVIDARLYYLEDETHKARQLLTQLSQTNWDGESTDALIDRAKAFHEVGMQEHALTILDEVERRYTADSENNPLLLHYIKQEKAEKKAISSSPKALNNIAVSQFQLGEHEQALSTLQQAFQVMPKNTAIALNLLQATANALREAPLQDSTNRKELIRRCMNVIESSSLTEHQEKRYARIKSAMEVLN
ncbi:response regulator [Alteromonas sp. C1M14]|uniref:response regulator n=1 Tax=Alteromonas sp. C1M14 TaxID=2841567 RepID=UPI001C099AB7|nr:response regulator [Alteromonas sp. C1M14]MBU2977460.1 response regulator [Alteromonas sp. C1M14]